MRLTLRAMLAYLDEMLEPADAQSLAEKIDASPIATDWMHRIRDVTRRLKLGAPKVSARGLTGDANSVAEYLDHTMAAEKVPEFEKLCLSSDVHLAEIASAHQILALVLGEPAEVDPKMRRRLYSVVDQSSPATAPEEGADAEVDHHEDVAVAATPRVRRQPEIPEWLRDQPGEGHWLRNTILAAVAAGAALIAFVWMNNRPGPVAEVANGSAQQSSVAAIPPASADLDRAPAVAETPGKSSETPLVTSDEQLVKEASPVDDGQPPESTEPIPQPPEPDEQAFAGTDAGAIGADTARGDAADMPDEFSTSPPPAERRTALNDPALRGDSMPDEPVAESGAVTAAAVGKLVSDNEILLRSPAHDGTWQRLSTRDALLADDELIALPTFRPGIALSTGGGAIAHLLGSTAVRLLAPDANDVPGMHVIDGQVIVDNAGKPGTQLNLRIGNETYMVNFLGADSSVAFDVRRSLLDGAPAQEDAVLTTAEMFVPSGEIEYVLLSTGQRNTLKAPAMRSLVAGNAEAAGEATFPGWIHGSPLSQVEKWAADALVKGLLPGEPVAMRLRELSENRRVEVRNLASQSMILLGDFESLLSVLRRDESQKGNWATQIEAVRRVLARDPTLADKLKATLDSQRDARKAKELYDMLRGYSRQQLQEGAAAQLVAALDNEDQDMRVLAFWNLQRISVGTLGYRPDFGPGKRQQSVRAWRERLEKGQLTPRS